MEDFSVKDLKKLKRRDLLELLLDEREENEALRARVSQLEHFIDANQITPESLGSLAEAALRLSNIFADADKAARLYLDGLRRITNEGGEFRDDPTRPGAGKPKALRRRSPGSPKP